MRISRCLLPVLVLLSGCATYDLARRDYVYEEVYFLTTRARTGSADLEERFGGGRGKAATGAAMVAIDPRRAFSRFAAPQPDWTLAQDQLLLRQPLQQVEELEPQALLDALAAGPAGADGRRDVLLFIHGYKRTFADAVGNAAHLRHELAFAGPVVAFCWPSTDKVAGYLPDMENLDWSVPELVRLIGDIGARVPAARIHVIAHSLGNRALVEALSQLVAESRAGAPWPLGEIVFMAPDFDREIFAERMENGLRGISSRMTLYVSADDLPLMASTSVFEYPRLGDSSEGVPVLEGIETIDVSDAVTVVTGHGYYEADSDTIEDLYHLIRDRKGASERPNLVEADAGAGRYWRLQPVE